MNPCIILTMVIVSTYNKSYLVEIENDKKSDPNIGARNDKNDYGQDYDPEIVPDVQPPPPPPKSQKQPGSNGPCSGNLEFGWAYPKKAKMNNDLNWGATDKKNSPQECQAHCNTFPRCVGYTWVDGLNNCWIKHDMAAHFRDNRGPGFISGRRNTCIGPAPWPLKSCGHKNKCEYETPPCPETNDYGQDYDPEIVPDVKPPQNKPGSTGPCIGLSNGAGNDTASKTACLKEDNTDYIGNALGHRKLKGVEECANLCGTVSACKFWTYGKSDRQCHIKSSNKGRKYDKNTISGPNKKSCVKGAPEFSPQHTPQPPPKPPAAGGCFPGTSMVMLDGGEKRSMEELRIGDIIMTVENGKLESTRVLGFLDKKINQTAYYINLILKDNRNLFISSRHAMFIKGDNNIIQSILAGDVSIGDMVIVDDGKNVEFVSISDITVELKMGAYVPLTHAGTLLVDGVLVSSYTNSDHWLAHITLSPLRWWPTLLLDTESSQNLEGLRIFPHLMRKLGRILGLVTMIDGKMETIENPFSGISQLAMEKMDKTEF